MTKKKAPTKLKKKPTKKLSQQKKSARKTLTTKQQRFVDFYDGNATDAARKAGYKGNDRTLRAVATENLAKPNIKAAIQKREEKRNNPLIADRQERQGFWTDGMRDKEAKRSDRQKDSELLGRSEGDFVDKVKHEHDITGAFAQTVYGYMNKAHGGVNGKPSA